MLCWRCAWKEGTCRRPTSAAPTPSEARPQVRAAGRHLQCHPTSTSLFRRLTCSAWHTLYDLNGFLSAAEDGCPCYRCCSLLRSLVSLHETEVGNLVLAHTGPSSEAVPSAAPEADVVPTSSAANGDLHPRASQKRTAEAAGIGVPQPPAESAPTQLGPTRTPAGGSAPEHSVEASTAGGGSAEPTVPAGTGSVTEPDARSVPATVPAGTGSVTEPDARSEPAQQALAGGAADLAVGNIAQRLRRNPSRFKSPQLALSPRADQTAAASGSRQDLRGAEQPMDSSTEQGSSAAGGPRPAIGDSAADGQAHAALTNLADSAAASLAEGACLAPPEASGQPSVGMQWLCCF